MVQGVCKQEGVVVKVQCQRASHNVDCSLWHNTVREKILSSHESLITKLSELEI